MPPNWLWGYLLPLGILLLMWGGLPPQRARRVTPLASLSVALAVLGYWALGFALHMGGARAVNPDDPALIGLDAMLPLVPEDRGWGIAGLAGFFLSGESVTPTVLGLFLAYLPLVATAVLLVVLALSEAPRWLMVLSGILVGAIVVPLGACWAWGSGWLAHLGETMSLAHGFVDFGGSGIVLWLPATVALGALLLLPKRAPGEGPLPPPPAYFPLLANMGALFVGIGWLGWTLAGPFHTMGTTWDWNRAGVSLFLGMSGAVLTSQLYAWLVTGDFEPLMSARGLGAGWGVILAGAPFMPPWAALVVGALGGLFFPLVLYAFEARLRLREPVATVALGVTGGLWGLLSVGLFADGQWGQGWNGINAFTGTGEVPPGVTGLFFGGEGTQLLAQFVGLLALGLWGLLWGVLLGFAAAPRWPDRFLSRLRARVDDTVPEKSESAGEPEDADSVSPIPEFVAVVASSVEEIVGEERED